MGTTNLFDFVNKEAEEKERNTIQPTIVYQVEAYQIARMKEQGSGRKVREIIDTIPVKNGNASLAKRNAIIKAERLGSNYFVIEKCERVLSLRKLTPQNEEEETEY